MKATETGGKEKSKPFSSNAFFSPVNWRVNTMINCYTCHQDADQSKTKIENPQYDFCKALVYGVWGH